MSPVLSPTASGHGCASPPRTTICSFPPSPDAQGPKPQQPWSGDDDSRRAPRCRGFAGIVEAGPGGSNSGSPAADCPPRSRGQQRRTACADGRTRDADATLVGIARLAACSPAAETARKSEERPEYFLLPVKSILNRCDSNRVPFEWTINPYRGCEFGCKYCYARYTHEYMELDGGEFEKKIYVKQNAARRCWRRMFRGNIPIRRREVGEGRAGAYRDRHGDRSVSAGGARVRRDARVSGGIGEARRVERFGDHEIESDRARHRCVEDRLRRDRSCR